MENEVIVICNGPSLANVELDFLKSRPSFGANGVYMLNGFTPSIYFATDQAFITAREEEIRDIAARTPAYIRRPWNDVIKGSKPFCKVNDHVWSFAPLDWVGSGGTVTFVMLQFAFASNANKVLLVGLDHDYFATASRPEHFDKDYLKGIDHPFDRLTSKKKLDFWRKQKVICNAGYQQAQEVFEHNGKEIINLTPGTFCDVFEKGDIEDYA